MGKWLWKVGGAVAVVVGVGVAAAGKKTWRKEAVVELVESLGVWAMPAYVGIHTVTLCLCLPYAVLLEASASLVFGFARGVACVFAAKLLAASLSFCLARLLFARSGWAPSNKYLGVVCRGVEQDGWRFVVAARLSPVPSYVLNYALAATRVRFLVDFLMPTAVGCIPMILQNASIGSLAGAAASTSSSTWTAYLFPLLGIVSTVVLSFRIKKYSQSSLLLDP